MVLFILVEVREAEVIRRILKIAHLNKIMPAPQTQDTLSLQAMLQHLPTPLSSIIVHFIKTEPQPMSVVQLDWHITGLKL